MKNLYLINKWLIILNAVLFIIPAYGLLFLIVLGISQLILALIILINFNILNRNGKIQFIVYTTITIIDLTIIKLMFNDRLEQSNIVMISILITSILLAFLNLNITYIIYKNVK